MINEIGLHLQTNATCREARRIRFGDFTLSHALIKKQWYAKPIVDNIKLCKPLCEGLRKKKHKTPKTLEHTKTEVRKELESGTDEEHKSDGLLIPG